MHSSHRAPFRLLLGLLLIIVALFTNGRSTAQESYCASFSESNCNRWEVCSWCTNLKVCVEDYASRALSHTCKCEDISSELSCNNALSGPADSRCLWCPSIARCVTNDTSNNNNSYNNPCAQCGYAMNQTSCEVLDDQSFAVSGVHQCQWCQFSAPTSTGRSTVGLCQNTTVADHSLKSPSCSCTNLDDLQCTSIAQRNKYSEMCAFSNNQCTSAVFPTKAPCSSIPNIGDCLNSDSDCKWCEKELGGGCVKQNQECSCYNVHSGQCPSESCQSCEFWNTCVKMYDPCTCQIFNKSACDTSGRFDCQWNDQFDICIDFNSPPPTSCNSLLTEFVCEKASCLWCKTGPIPGFRPGTCVDNSTTCSCLSGTSYSCSLYYSGSSPNTPECTTCYTDQTSTPNFPHPIGISSFCINTSLPSQSSCQEFRCSSLTEKQCLDSQLNTNYCTWCSALSHCTETQQVYANFDLNEYPVSAYNEFVTCSCQVLETEAACSSPQASSSCHFCQNSDSCLPLSSPCVPLRCDSITNETKCQQASSSFSCTWQPRGGSFENTGDACLVADDYLHACDLITSKYTCLRMGCLWCDQSNNDDDVYGCTGGNSMYVGSTNEVQTIYNLSCSCMRFGQRECEGRGAQYRGRPPLPAFKNARCGYCEETSACVYNNSDPSGSSNDPCLCSSIAERYASTPSGAISSTKFAGMKSVTGISLQCSLCPAPNGSATEVLVHNVVDAYLNNFECSCQGLTQSSCASYPDECFWCSDLRACVNVSNVSAAPSSMCRCSAFDPTTCPYNNNPNAPYNPNQHPRHYKCQLCGYTEEGSPGHCIDNPNMLTSTTCNCANLPVDQCTNEMTGGWCAWQQPILVGSSKAGGYCASSQDCQNVLTCSGLNVDMVVTSTSPCESAGCRFDNGRCVSQSGCFIFFLPSFVIQPVALLFLGFFKDFVVLLFIGAFGDVIARKLLNAFSSLIYKVRKWDDKKIINLVAQKSIYMSDKQCVEDDTDGGDGEYLQKNDEAGLLQDDDHSSTDDIDTIKSKHDAKVQFSGSFSNYAKAVAVKFFDVVASPASDDNDDLVHATNLERKTTMILDAVHFSLTSNNLWVDLNSVDTINSVDDGENSEASAPREEDDEQQQENAQHLPQLLDDDLFSSRVRLQTVVDEIITHYASAFVFYRTSRDVKTRIANSVNSFPSSLQLVYYTASSVFMALLVFYSVVLDPENSKKVSQIANFTTCQQLPNPSSYNPDTNVPANVTGSSSSSTVGFWLIGFRLLNSSALSTVILILVKVIRGLWQNFGGRFDKLSLTQQLPLLSLYSSRPIHILLSIYFCIFAPFIFAGVFYGPTVNIYVLIPVGVLVLFALIFIIKCFYDYCSARCRRTDGDNPNSSTPPPNNTPQREEEEYRRPQTSIQYAVERDSELATEHDDENSITNHEEGDKERSETTGAPPPAAESTLATFFQRQEEAESHRQDHGEPPASLPATHNNLNDDNNVHDANNSPSAAAQLSEQLLPASENGPHEGSDDTADNDNNIINYNNNDRATTAMIERALWGFLLAEELPTICITIAIAMSFNYMLLTKFAFGFGITDTTEVMSIEWQARSVSCIAETFEGDLSGAWSSLTAFLPFS